MVGLAWLPISIALAGNLVLNFNGSRGSVWLGFTLAIALAVFGVVGWALINRLLRGLLRARSSSKAA
jgi:drug/metabolite transporter (DMT)-like permease